jgi:hypothetical protein
MKLQLTNAQAQSLYWIADDAQYTAKGLILTEIETIVAENPYNNPNVKPIIDTDICGYWLYKEAADFIKFQQEDNEPIPRPLQTIMDKLEGTAKATERRFKMLALLALNVGVWDDKMQELGDKLDDNHPDAVEALRFYEDKIIEVLEMTEEPKQN